MAGEKTRLSCQQKSRLNVMSSPPKPQEWQEERQERHVNKVVGLSRIKAISPPNPIPIPRIADRKTRVSCQQRSRMNVAGPPHPIPTPRMAKKRAKSVMSRM